MRALKKILGIASLVTGAILGLYLGVWCLFIGGIVQIISAIKFLSGYSLSIAILIGLIKICISGLIGWASFYIMFALSILFFYYLHQLNQKSYL